MMRPCRWRVSPFSITGAMSSRAVTNCELMSPAISIVPPMMGLPLILSGGKALLALIGDLGTKQPERINQLADGALAHPL